MLPLSRLAPRYFYFPALAAGSVAPDLPYFLWARSYAASTHAPLNGLWLSGACAIVLFGLYRFLYPSLAALLPGAPVLRPLPSLLVVVTSLWLGIESHIVWDSFTHDWGWSVRALPALQANLITVGSYEVRGFKVAQHLSTLIGLAVVAWPVHAWPFPMNPERRVAWAAILVGAGLWGTWAAVDARGTARLFEFVTAGTRAGVVLAVLAVLAGAYLGRVMSNRSRVRV